MRMLTVILGLIFMVVLLTKCTTTESTMRVCKQLCQHNVKSFGSSDTDCVCQ